MTNLRCYLCAICFLCHGESFLYAEDEMMVIDSGLADYDGRKITLSGNAVVEHELGKISAKEMVLLPSQDEKKNRFAYLRMQDNVMIALKDGGQLSCSIADLDYRKMKGNFSGSPQQEYVIYTETCKDKSGARIPLVVKSRQMSMHIVREEMQEGQPKSYISDINADQNVTINYNHDFIAAADHGIYWRQPEIEGEGKTQMTAPGMIALRADEKAGICQVTNRNGDLIRAVHITIDTVKRHLTFAYPKGAIYVPRPQEALERIDFSSDILMWDEPREILTLRENVIVNQKGIGTLTTDKELQLYQHLVNGKRQLRTIESEGTSILTNTEEEKGISHVITCYGKVILNHESLEALMESPLDQKGVVEEGKQVFFQDNMGEIHADKVKLKYELVDHTIVPAKLIVEGNVNIIDRYALNSNQTGNVLRYVLADTVEYLPATKEITFSSKDRRRVLFFDKLNNIQVSAPALKIKRDQTTTKETIQGFGDVRFSLIEQEFDQLKKKFGFAKDTEG